MIFIEDIVECDISYWLHWVINTFSIKIKVHITIMEVHVLIFSTLIFISLLSIVCCSAGVLAVTVKSGNSLLHPAVCEVNLRRGCQIRVKINFYLSDWMLLPVYVFNCVVIQALTAVFMLFLKTEMSINWGSTWNWMDNDYLDNNNLTRMFRVLIYLCHCNSV